MARSVLIKGIEHTDPNADANDHGYFWGAVAERFQRVDCDVAAVPTHSCQSDACGLDCHLVKADMNIPEAYLIILDLCIRDIKYWHKITIFVFLYILLTEDQKLDGFGK